MLLTSALGGMLKAEEGQQTQTRHLFGLSHHLTQNPTHNGDFAEFSGRTLADFDVPSIVISKPWSGRDLGNKEKT